MPEESLGQRPLPVVSWREESGVNRGGNLDAGALPPRGDAAGLEGRGRLGLSLEPVRSELVVRNETGGRDRVTARRLSASQWTASNRLRGEQVEVRLAGDTVKISKGGVLLKTHIASADIQLRRSHPLFSGRASW